MDGTNKRLLKFSLFIYNGYRWDKMKYIDLKKENIKLIEENLFKYGFIKEQNYFIYKKNMLNKDFTLEVLLDVNTLKARLFDNETNEEYYLVDINNASGNYIGSIKEEYEEEISKILDICAYKDTYNSNITNEILKYTEEKYKEKFEFPFKTTKETSIVRHKENEKWYALITSLTKDKLGLNSCERVEIINLKNTKEKVQNIIDNTDFFPAYHMNKKHWFTIILDGSVSIEKIKQLIDESYNLTK